MEFLKRKTKIINNTFQNNFHQFFSNSESKFCLLLLYPPQNFVAASFPKLWLCVMQCTNYYFTENSFEKNNEDLGIHEETNNRSRGLEVLCKKDVIENFAKLAGKHLCQSTFFNKALL